MKTRIIALILCVVLSFSLVGCDMFTTNNEELLYPPRLTGKMRPIEQALEDSIKGEYTLKYPSSGERRSAFLLEDINGDGYEEAFAFYSTSDDDLTTMHINAIIGSGKEWRSASEQNVIASGFEKVEFSDLDGDGIKEIIVGWEIYAQSEKRVMVYSLKNDKLVPKLTQSYTSFIACDLDENGKNELFIHLLDTANSINTAALYSVEKDEVVQISGCVMDKKVSETRKPILSKLSNGMPALYIDEVKGVAAITEVLYVKDGQLTNGLLDIVASYENLLTVRPHTVFCKDLDNDGIYEIPVSTILANADSQSKEELYYVNWCNYDGQILAQKDVSIINSADGYSLDIPEKWVGNIAVLKNTADRTRTIYTYDTANASAGVKMLTYKAQDLKDWNKKTSEKNGYVEICRLEQTVYSVLITAYDGELSISKQTAIDIFSLIE